MSRLLLTPNVPGVQCVFCCTDLVYAESMMREACADAIQVLACCGTFWVPRVHQQAQHLQQAALGEELDVTASSTCSL